MLKNFFSLVSHDIGIDLGTANTMVLIGGKGLAIREPSVVARHRKTKNILAIGQQAKKMLGKTPASIEAVKPLSGGVIADYEATEAMLKHFIRRVVQGGRMVSRLSKPRVVVGIPSGVTEVERKAVQDASLSAGSRKTFLIEEPMAAAIGVDLPVEAPEGLLIVDIGGGTTEIAVISLGGIVIDRCLRVAGDEMDKAIANYMRLKYSLLLGEATTEDIKIRLGSAYPSSKDEKDKQMVVRGRDIESGLPRSLKINSVEVREALSPVIRQIIDQVSGVIEETPPELVGDILKRGMTLCGGVAQLEGLDKLMAEETKMPVWVVDDPMTAVVRGCGRVLADEALLKKVQVTGGLR